MALTASKKIQSLRSDLRVKRVFAADAGTYYAGEIVIFGPASGTAKPISGSAESGVQVVGIVANEQVIATAGDNLEVEAGYFVLSGSGFTNDEVNKIAYSNSSTAVYDAHSAGYHAIGRFKGFTTVGNGTNNCVVDVGNVRSGSSL